MRTLILGAAGQLGRDLLEVFRREGEVRGLEHSEADVSDEVTLQPLIEDFGPELLINAAAYKAGGGGEGELERAFLVNETGARNVAELAAHHQIPVVYFSSNYVFGGSGDRPLRPEDPIAPRGLHGDAKAAGEQATRKANAKHYIVRTAWLYGPGGDNFVEKILRAAELRSKLKVVRDEIGSPTHTLDLAEAVLALTRCGAFGDYHIVNGGACTRFEFAEAILSLAGSEAEVLPCAVTELPSAAERPIWSVLDSGKFETVAGHTMRPWREALAAYIVRRNGNRSRGNSREHLEM